MTKAEKELIFDHDTPIKGHKLKSGSLTRPVKSTNVMPQEKNSVLADKYFAKVQVPDYSSHNDVNRLIIKVEDQQQIYSGNEGYVSYFISSFFVY